MQIVPHPTRRGVFQLRAELWLPRPIDDVFAFFSDAFNLQEITPPWLNFHVVTPRPILLAEGTLIDYKLRLHGIPLRWRSEICGWQPPYRFIDRQLRGPYRLWHHEHLFEEKNGGTLCTDVVDYAVYGGALVNSFFVKPDLQRIFQYRTQRLHELLGQAGIPAVTP